MCPFRLRYHNPMTQEFVCRNDEGILLCSDSLVVEEKNSGDREFHSFRKLYPLGTHAAILSAGAKVGIDLSSELSDLVAQRGLGSIETVLPLAQDFLNRGYARFVEEGRDWFAAHPDAYRRLYFVIAGFSHEAADKAFRFCLLGSEDLELPFQIVPTGNFLTMPRRLGFEMKLAGAVPKSSLAELAKLCNGYLKQLGDKEPDRVGPPHYAATITRDGFAWYPGAGPD